MNCYFRCHSLASAVDYCRHFSHSSLSNSYCRCSYHSSSDHPRRRLETDSAATVAVHYWSAYCYHSTIADAFRRCCSWCQNCFAVTGYHCPSSIVTAAFVSCLRPLGPTKQPSEAGSEDCCSSWLANSVIIPSSCWSHRWDSTRFHTCLHLAFAYHRSCPRPVPSQGRPCFQSTGPWSCLRPLPIAGYLLGWLTWWSFTTL